MKLLLTGAFSYSQDQLDQLKSSGFEITFVQDEREEVSFRVDEFRAVVCNGLFLKTPIERFKNLKFLQLTSAGTERIPISYIKNHAITLKTAAGVYSTPMAEWVVGKILEIYKKSHEFRALQQKNQWHKIRNLKELTGKNALIVGMGGVGTAIAKRLQAFEVNVWGVDKDFSNLNHESYSKSFGADDLHKMLPIADIIALCVPLTPETRTMIGKNELDLMKDDAIVLNTSRGEIIDEQALIDCLQKGKFDGVALDVFQTEPLPANSPLWAFPQVIATPHISFISDQVNHRLFQLVKTNLIDFKTNNG